MLQMSAAGRVPSVQVVEARVPVTAKNAAANPPTPNGRQRTRALQARGDVTLDGLEAIVVGASRAVPTAIANAKSIPELHALPDMTSSAGTGLHVVRRLIIAHGVARIVRVQAVGTLRSASTKTPLGVETNLFDVAVDGLERIV